MTTQHVVTFFYRDANSVEEEEIILTRCIVDDSGPNVIKEWAERVRPAVLKLACDTWEDPPKHVQPDDVEIRVVPLREWIESLEDETDDIDTAMEELEEPEEEEE